MNYLKLAVPYTIITYGFTSISVMYGFIIVPPIHRLYTNLKVILKTQKQSHIPKPELAPI